MDPRSVRQLLGHGAVWGTLVLAAAANLAAVPSGVAFPNLYGVPLLTAALVWSPRAVAALLAFVLAAVALDVVALGAPSGAERVRLVGLLLLGVLTVQTARVRRAARAADEARDAFVAAAAHDLKNPLTVVRGEAQHLRRQVERREPAPSPQQARLDAGLERIDAAAGRTLALLNALLDAVRLQAGQSLDLVRHPTDLVALVERVAAAYQTTAEGHRIVVRAAVPALVGEWDAFRLERVVENLLANAVKYSPAGGEIDVRVRTEPAARPPMPSDAGVSGTWAVLTVRDQGVGIPAVDLRRVFRPYQRGRNVAGAVPGMGIGLAGARQIVEQHGGTITAASREGEGSTFTVRLPVGPVAT